MKKKRRKNFFSTLVLIIALWAMLATLVSFVDPTSLLVIPLFFLLFFLASLFTLSALLGSGRRGFLAALFLSLFLLLRFFGVGHILNLLLLSGIVISLEMYFSR